MKTTITILCLLIFWESSNAQNKCRYWQAKVDWDTELPESSTSVNETGDQSVVEAINCFLALEGKHQPSKLQGATNPRVSQTFPPAPVEVAALYYISYLFKQKWDHADAIALVESGNIHEFNPPDGVKRAYEYYRAWFKKVQRVGLAKAREMKLEPLDGKDVRWY
jgi:hypothetical protein